VRVHPSTRGELEEVNSDMFGFQVDYFANLVSEVLPCGCVVHSVEDHTELLAEAHGDKERQLVLNDVYDQNSRDTLHAYWQFGGEEERGIATYTDCSRCTSWKDARLQALLRQAFTPLVVIVQTNDAMLCTCV